MLIESANWDILKNRLPNIYNISFDITSKKTSNSSDGTQLRKLNAS
jgi:hypothetical protein